MAASLETLKARRQELVAEMQALGPTKGDRAKTARHRELEADLGNVNRAIKAANIAADLLKREAAAARREASAEETAAHEKKRAAKAASKARKRAERCHGCAAGYPTRQCAVTGGRQHRGPDYTFACLAVGPPKLTRDQLMLKLARKLTHLALLDVPPDGDPPARVVDLVTALGRFIPEQEKHVEARKAEALSEPWEPA